MANLQLRTVKKGKRFSQPERVWLVTSRLGIRKSLTFFTVWRVACSQRTLPVDRGKIIDIVQYSEIGMKPKATFVDSCM